MLAKIAWRNLFLHGRKSLSALLSIVMACIALSLFEGYIHNVHHLYDATFSRRQMLGDVIIERDGLAHPGKAGLDEEALDEKQQEWIEAYLKKASVAARVRFLNVNGFIASGPSSDIFVGLAYDPLEGAELRAPDYVWNTFAGVPLEEAQAKPSLVIGHNLARILGCTTGLPPLNGTIGLSAENRPFHCKNSTMQLQVNTESGQSNAMDFLPAGLIATGFAEVDAHMVMMPLALAHKLYNTKKVSFLTLRLQPGVDAKMWLEEFQRDARAAGFAFSARSWKDHETFGDLFRNSIDFLEVFRNFVVSIILVVVTMAIMNTFVRTVYERLQELGTLRSIGYRPYHILAIFSWEAVFLALAGSGLGIGAAYLVAAACNRLGLRYNAGFLSEGVLFKIDLQASDFAWITGLIIGLTMASTCLASWRASHLKISEILAEK